MAFKSTSTKSPMADDYAKLALIFCTLHLLVTFHAFENETFFLFSRKATVTVNHLGGYAWSRCDTLAKKAENIQNVPLEMTTKIWTPKPRQIECLAVSCIKKLKLCGNKRVCFAEIRT